MESWDYNYPMRVTPLRLLLAATVLGLLLFGLYVVVERRKR
jgi:hypothetical protein